MGLLCIHLLQISGSVCLPKIMSNVNIIFEDEVGTVFEKQCILCALLPWKSCIVWCAALEAMRKAHEQELEKERKKFLDLLAKTQINTDLESVQKRHEYGTSLFCQFFPHVS